MRNELLTLVSQVQDEGLDYSDCFAPGEKPGTVKNTILVDHLIANNVVIQKIGNWSLRCEQRKEGDGDLQVKFYLECSECHRQIWRINQDNARNGEWKALVQKYPYCHCGAKMNGGFEHEE